MALQQPFSLYNPGLLPPDVLLREFTARRGLLRRLLDVIQNNESGQSPQHCLLIGPRGMGKTTTLWAIAHSITRDLDLAAVWHPIVFDEESRSIGDLADFWLKCLRFFDLDDSQGEGTKRADRLLSADPMDLEGQALAAFVEMLKQIDRRAVLLVDNINEIFSSLSDAETLHRFRSQLMESDRLCIVGTATRQFSEVTHVDRSFFDFFRIFNLVPLKLEEMRKMLLDLADERDEAQVRVSVEEHAHTIEILHTLTGGNPRLIKTFYRLLAEGMAGDVRQELERLVDDYTPYLKAILDALSPQQQRVIDAIALAWNPVETGEISRVTRLPSNQVSAQLRTLIKQGLVIESVGGTKKKKLYLLADRFSNIHYLMRHGRAARGRFDWFILTLFALMPDRAGQELGRVTVNTLLGGSEVESRLIAQAAARLGDARSQSQMARQMLRELWATDCLDKLSSHSSTEWLRKQLGESLFLLWEFFSAVPLEVREGLGFDPASAQWWLETMDPSRYAAVWSQLEKSWRAKVEANPDDAPTWRRLAKLYRLYLSQYGDAETAYRRAIALDSGLASMWLDLGFLVEICSDRFDEAESAYRQAISIEPGDPTSLSYLGDLLGDRMERYGEAEVAYRSAINADPRSGPAWTGLSRILSRDPQFSGEAQIAAKTGLMCFPNYGPAQSQFRILCIDSPESLAEVLPVLSTWCHENPKREDVFDFAFDIWIRHAILTSPTDSLTLMDSLPSWEPFETVRDAFLASANKEYLHRLAPERASATLRILERLNTENLMT